ncbi:M23 family metallopeptidase [Segatella intestinalis]|uniref:M23 family metallopeptidase n=1 Tax=Segatella intestinalis TaxID=3035284 RepID=UPI0023EDD429|nr:M23 family metallopeptidase [Prevotella sp. B2-R-102]MDF4241552.1 M23 family metallopeptidase [Prevotella sp. B2-R-102]
MKRKIVALWVISCLAVSSAKAQFNTVSDNVCRYKVKKVEEKFLLPANQPVDSIQANLLQQETDSMDSKQKQRISSYPSITYPLKSIKVTSPYGYRRDPINGRKSMHHGIDLQAHNEYVYSMMDGKVEKVGYDARSGNYIILRHADFTISYCHLSKVHLAPGTPVFAGTIIGRSGSTGRATGEHLHIVTKHKGIIFDPKILFCYIKSHQK